MLNHGQIVQGKAGGKQQQSVRADQRPDPQGQKGSGGREDSAGVNPRGDPLVHRIDLQQVDRKLIISLSMFIPVHLAPPQNLVYLYPSHLVWLHHPQHCILQVSTVVQTSES